MADKKTLEYEITLISHQAAKQLQGMSLQFKELASEAQTASSDLKKDSTTFTSLETAAKQAAASVRLFGASSSELRAMQQKIKEGAVALVAQGFEPEREEVKKLVEQYKALGNQADELERKNGDLTSIFSKLKSEIGNVAAVAAAVKFDRFLVKVGDYALQSADAINTVRNNFGIMLNDMEAGAALADRINAFNVSTPFNLEQVSTATQVLKTAKVGLNDIEEYLTRFGDLALGDAQKFASFTNAFAKASAKGKADMEVLNIYMERGIPILDTLAKKMGKTTAEITDMASKGKISFNDLNDAIRTLTDEGGGYFGTMNLAADSWASTLAGAREATNSLVASLGNMLMPILKKIVNAYTDITNAINSSPLLKGLLVGAVTALAVAINMKMIVALVALVTRIWTTYAAQMALNSALSLTNPLMLAGIAAVTAATAGFVAYAAAQQKAAGASNEAALAAQKQKDAIESLKTEAEDYMSFMSGSSLSQAQKTVDNYTKAVDKAKNTLAASKQTLSTLESQLASTPKTTPLPYKGYTGYVDKTRQYENPDYAELEKKVVSARRIVDSDQNLYDTLNARLDAAQKNTGVLKQKILDFTTEWSEKLAEGNSSAINRIKEQEKKAIAALTKQAESAFGGNYKNKSTTEYKVYQRELTALQNYYSNERKKIYDKEVEEALKSVNTWLSKGGVESQLTALEQESKQTSRKLSEAALTAYGKEYQKRTEYIKAAANLEKYYADQNHKVRLSQIDEYSSKFSKTVQNLELAKVEAIKTGDFKTAATSAAKSSALSSAGGSGEIGGAVQGFFNGGVLGGIIGIIISFISALATAISSLENGSKVLNFATTIISRIMDYLGPIINELLEPFADILEVVGEVLGKFLRPFAELLNILIHLNPFLIVIEAVLNGIAWLLEKLWDVLKYVFNGIVTVYNFIADVLGMLGVHIKHMKKFGESATEISEAAEKQATLLKKQYERQMNAVNELLNAQVKSIQSQYELGLISREQYNEQAERYAAAAEDKLYELEKEMNEKLGSISDNTGDSGTLKLGLNSLGDLLKNFVSGLGDFLSNIADNITNFANSMISAISSAATWLGDKILGGINWVGEKISSITNFAGSAASSAGDFISSAASWIGKKTGWWDVGSYEIPADQFGVVHKGETIVPRTFAEGIRSGKLALVGGNNRNSQGGVIYNLQLTVEGSVVTEREITDVVYNGIARAIQSGSKAPLPMAG